MRAFTHEPIAVVGLSSILPGSSDEPCGGDETWARLESMTPAAAKRLGDAQIDVARFAIPPVQARSIARMQLLVLLAVERCLADAGYHERSFPRERTDVFTGTCFGLDRQLVNAQRVESAPVAQAAADALARARPDALRADLDAFASIVRRAFEHRYAGSAHDRVGEMASTIPARVAAAFRLQGRTMAIEAADATSFAALEHAVLALRAGASDAAIVAAGQRVESPLLAAALAAKGMLAEGTFAPFDVSGAGISPAEGVGALFLKRLSTALRDGDRIYGTIVGVGTACEARTGTFRYPTSIESRASAIARACADGDVSRESIQYVECSASGVGADVREELRALARDLPGAGAPVVVGSIKDRLGHTWAHAGLAGVSRALLAMHRRELPATLPSARTALAPHADRLIALSSPQVWPANEEAPRRAGVGGSSFTGASWHVVLEEYDSRATRRARPAGPRPGSARARTDDDVAVVAMGARFADAPDAGTFWTNTWAKRDTIQPLPEALFSRAAYFDPRSMGGGRAYTDVGSRVIVPSAPPEECRVPPRRHAAMDRAQRLALHVGSELRRSYARERPCPPGAGLVAIATNLSLGVERLTNAALGVGELEQVLEGLGPFRELSARERGEVRGAVRDAFAAVGAVGPASLDGWLASGIGAVVASELGFGGVPIAVEAACASSLASIDLAVRALRSRSYDFAIAGGVELSCGPRELVLCSALRLLSRTRIAPFDARADGFSAGDGMGLFLLRRLHDAEQDGDSILGVIRGVGASNDARSLIAPDAAGQALAIRRAFDEVDFGPESVQYVEAHGTGTEVGDQAEVRALAAVYGATRRAAPLAVGSVKSMIGHTFAAAGSAGLLRVLLGMRARTLPPTLVTGHLHPKLGLHDIPAYVATDVAPWAAPLQAPRRAAVSSFGTGGINFHVLVEEHTRTS